ncbi:BolA/IbaG family iron-sulfur metabolism protein [Flavobacteriaceae bacterium]|nr:BolA/IbaG family iron-sulfur metabolism protein [Flavobacteriaceae bacterium]
MPIAQSELAIILQKSFPDAKVQIIDLAGDDNHYKIIIEDVSFFGKSKIAQHRMVNKALEEELLSETLHAMQLQTIPVEIQ